MSVWMRLFHISLCYHVLKGTTLALIELNVLTTRPAAAVVVFGTALAVLYYSIKREGLFRIEW